MPRFEFTSSHTRRLAHYSPHDEVCSDTRASNNPYAHLLRLLGLLRLLCKLSLASRLGRLRSSLRVKDEIPPAERASIVSNEALVVDIVVLGAGPEGQEVVQRPGELVAGVCIDGLEETADDPEVHGEDVQVTGDGAPCDGSENGTGTEDHDFDGRGVLSGETEGGRVVVVDLVNRAVERTPVHGAVSPVVPGVLDDEEDSDVHCDLPHGREGDAGVHAKEFSHGVEDPDLGELDGEVGEENQLGALPLFLGGGYFSLGWVSVGWEWYGGLWWGRGSTYSLNLVFVEVGHAVDDNPGERAAKVDNFVHHEGHDSCREDVVLHVCVPSLGGMLAHCWNSSQEGRTYGPETLKDIESLAIVVSDAIVLVPVCRRGEESAVCCVPMKLIRTNFPRYFSQPPDRARSVECIARNFLSERRRMAILTLWRYSTEAIRRLLRISRPQSREGRCEV